ncbi:uncharacterized protein V6R79_011200 [Siganus canaliculatus]
MHVMWPPAASQWRMEKQEKARKCDSWNQPGIYYTYIERPCKMVSFCFEVSRMGTFKVDSRATLRTRWWRYCTKPTAESTKKTKKEKKRPGGGSFLPWWMLQELQTGPG